MPEAPSRARIEFEGIVQGVGFRPFLNRLANEMELAGWVLNSSAGVLLELEGPQERLREYVRRVKAEAPPLSRILITRVRFLSAIGYQGFSIKPSRLDPDALTLLCPDVATCNDCLRELFDPADRRYRYPFINCTNCGPRYTIVHGLPYDRPQTTMSQFKLCPVCQAEYDTVVDRRYHAQPVACPDCGPQVWFEDPAGQCLGVDPISHAVELLRAGAVLAAKGIGGFHLACRADLDAPVLALRKRKQRSFFKPLAVMLADLETAHKLCEVDDVAAGWLTSSAAPIVLLRLKPGVAGNAISQYVAPNLQRLGIMLPYSPLHHILLAETGSPLVMTSGNLSDDPITADNTTARERLGGLVDGLLLHNRPILARCDDSVLAADTPGSCTMLRLSRGFTPFPVALPEDGPSVLAFGGDIKTTFAVSRGRFAFLSPHLGDADHVSTYAFFRETWEHYKKLFHLKPEAVACDLHPGYHSARWAGEVAAELGVPLYRVQHHHAHLAALLTEHGMTGPCPAIVADGTGYGADGSIWGGEVLWGDVRSFRRVAHLHPIQLPGGDAAAAEPWRIAIALLYAAAPEELTPYTKLLLSGGLEAKLHSQHPKRISALNNPHYAPPTTQEVALVIRMIETGTNIVSSTALGRLFDGVAALLGVTLHTNYEGQAPMELEALAEQAGPPEHDSPVGDEAGPVDGLDWRPWVKACVCSTQPAASLAYQLHQWVSGSFVNAVIHDEQAHASPVILASGGCMQNGLLMKLLTASCDAKAKQLVVHREIPAGDGGLALGVLRIAQTVHVAAGRGLHSP